MPSKHISTNPLPQKSWRRQDNRNSNKRCRRSQSNNSIAPRAANGSLHSTVGSGNVIVLHKKQQFSYRSIDGKKKSQKSTGSSASNATSHSKLDASKVSPQHQMHSSRIRTPAQYTSAELKEEIQTLQNPSLNTLRQLTHKSSQNSSQIDTTPSSNKKSRHRNRANHHQERKLSGHAFQSIIQDCLMIVFQYHIQFISRKAIRKLDLGCSGNSRAAKWNRQSLHMLRHLISSFEFDERCDNRLKRFFRLLNEGTKKDRPPYSAVSSPRNTTISSSFDANSRTNLTRTQQVSTTNCSRQNKILYYVKIHRNNRINDRIFRFFQGIHTLDLCGIQDASVTNHAFENIRGIHCLNISNTRFNITEAAFAHLMGLKCLNASRIRSAIDWELACQHMFGVEDLDLSFCMLSDRALEHVKGDTLRKLSVQGARGLTSEAFQHMLGVEELNLSHLPDESIWKESIFDHLIHVKVLNIEQKNFSFLIREQVRKKLNPEILKM